MNCFFFSGERAQRLANCKNGGNDEKWFLLFMDNIIQVLHITCCAIIMPCFFVKNVFSCIDKKFNKVFLVISNLLSFTLIV